MITEIKKKPTQSKIGLLDRYLHTRNLSEEICKPLEIEDYVVQPITDVSPPKWHLGHTTWFFETFILLNQKGYQPFHENFSFIFNSYYESVGKRVIRTNRGNLSRPTVHEIYEYRHYVDRQMVQFFREHPALDEQLKYVIEVGINHEQQHQELLITDIKYILGHNPLFPDYSKQDKLISPEIDSINFLEINGGLYFIGHNSDEFCYDNELGCHQVFVEDFEVADRVISNGEYLEFIKDGGYNNFNYWLSEGWDWVNKNQIKKPLYWHLIDGDWYEYTLAGLEKLKLDSPVTHISYFEADAFASWKGMRLPTEYEWEIACNLFKKKAKMHFFLKMAVFILHTKIRTRNLSGTFGNGLQALICLIHGLKRHRED